MIVVQCWWCCGGNGVDLAVMLCDGESVTSGGSGDVDLLWQ